MSGPRPFGARWRAPLVSVAAAGLALALALAVTSLVLLASGQQPGATFALMLEYGLRPRTLSLTINSAITYYFAALAVAIGFRANLFNIGVDGQYRLAALVAAAVGAAVTLPPALHVGVILLVAVLTGAAWAGIAGLLRVYRGVSEVISTIMLNFLATGLVAYLLTPEFLGRKEEGSNTIGTAPIGPSGRVPGLSWVPDSPLPLFGLGLLAVAAGVLFWFTLERTRFGFELRAVGAGEPAARAGGVHVPRMLLVTMLLSGGVAGLVGMPQLLGASYTYSTDFPAGLGFTGIAIALVGRNSAVGIGFGALLFGFLDNSAQILDLEGVAKEIVLITQGVIVLSVVVAYELVRRWEATAAQRAVGRVLG